MKKRWKILLVATVALGAATLFMRETPEEKEARHIARGKVLFEQGEYRKARLEYKNAAQISPTDPEIAYRWGLVDEAEGDIRSAYLAFSRAVDQNPRFHAAILKIAHYHLVAENIEEVQKRVDAVLAEAPDNAEAHALNAALLLRKKDYENTEKEARFALSKDPANVTAYSVLTGLAMAKGDIEAAGTTVDEGIARNPRNILLPLLKTKIYESPLNVEKFREAYQSIFKLRPDKSQFRVEYAEALLRANKPEEAETALREASAAFPADKQLKRKLIAFLDKQRGIDAAEKQIREYMQADAKNDELYFWLADLYIAHNDIDKAVALFEQIVSKDPGNKQSLNAQASLARIKFNKGDKDTAEKMITAILEKSRNNKEALYIRAGIAADHGQYQNAVTDLRSIIRDNPRSKDALQLLAEVLLLQGYTDLAMETQNQLMDLDPANSAVRVRLAQMYTMNNDPQGALKQLDIVTRTAPNYPVGWENKARSAIAMKDFATAKAAIEILGAMEGQAMTASFLTGQIAAANGKSDDAIASYTAIISADPNSPLAAHALYSMTQATKGDKQKLEKLVTYLTSLKTDNAYVSTILGESYIQLGKPELAKAAFDTAIANKPLDQAPYLNRAKMHMADKKGDEALALLAEANKALPDDRRALLLKASILRVLGRYKEAVALYEDILRNNPAVDEAANNMAAIIADYLYDDADMLKKAEQAVEKFQRSENPLVMDTLAWVYYRQGKFSEAKDMFTHIMTLDSKLPPEIHYHYGAALWKSGKIAEAKAELRQSVTGNTDFTGLEDAKKILAEIENTNK